MDKQEYADKIKNIILEEYEEALESDIVEYMRERPEVFDTDIDDCFQLGYTVRDAVKSLLLTSEKLHEPTAIEWQANLRKKYLDKKKA